MHKPFTHQSSYNARGMSACKRKQEGESLCKHPAMGPSHTVILFPPVLRPIRMLAMDTQHVSLAAGAGLKPWAATRDTASSAP